MQTITPVILLTGYLGSGKTTLVNHILLNKKGIKFAVVVNDIGEVNIDAELLQKGGIVGKRDESLVALQNGCICCTLKMDLVEQINEILKMERFDYIVIEASGICEPEPIARTICSIPSMNGEYTRNGIAGIDCIVTVVDAVRMQSEFSCGDDLIRKNIDDEDIENLLIQQIEFCNIVLLNKAADVQPNELQRIKEIIKNLQPGVEIIESNYADVALEKIINTRKFNYNKTATSAGWIQGIEGETEEEEHGEHKHHEHEHHDHDEEGEAEEFGIGTFVYYRRKALNDRKFDELVCLHWPKSIIRAKGVCYFSNNRDMSYLFEQAGVQKNLTEAGYWLATAPKEELDTMVQDDPSILRDWDETYGDRMVKIVFIGQNLNKEQIIQDLDNCLE